MVQKDRVPRKDSAEESAPSTWVRIVTDHPVLSAALVSCMLSGAVLAWAFLPVEIETYKRLAGGALLGLLSWLMVMMGRMLD